jgi:hypothetical protein
MAYGNTSGRLSVSSGCIRSEGWDCSSPKTLRELGCFGIIYKLPSPSGDFLKTPMEDFLHLMTEFPSDFDAQALVGTLLSDGCLTFPTQLEMLDLS